jgi:hypothetical protein
MIEELVGKHILQENKTVFFGSLAGPIKMHTIKECIKECKIPVLLYGNWKGLQR